MIYSKSKEERSKPSEQHDLVEPSAEIEQIIAGNCVMLVESNPWTMYCFSQGQKKEHLSRMREMQFRETSADTERIKYNANGTKTGSPKNIDLLRVKRRHSWIQWSNKIQQHFCWSSVNHCYQCTKWKIIASKHEKENETSQNIRQYIY